MCECNCGDFNPYRAYRVGSFVLVMEIYYGCASCNNPIDVALHIMTPEYAKDLDIDVAHLPEFAPANGHDQRYFSLIGKDDLVEWADMRKEEIAVYDNLIDYLRDHGLDMLQGGLEIRIDKVKKIEDKSK